MRGVEAPLPAGKLKGAQMPTLKQAYLLRTGKALRELRPFEAAWLSPENERLLLNEIARRTQFEFRPDEWFLTTMFATASMFSAAPLATPDVLEKAREWYITRYDSELVQRALDVELEASRLGVAPHASERHSAPIDIRGIYKRQRKGDIAMAGEMMFMYDEIPTPALNGEEDVEDDLEWR